jgi:hypothetical protein
MNEGQATKAKRIPRLRKAGWLRHQKNAAGSFEAQTGRLQRREASINGRAALLIDLHQSGRCASICKDAARHQQPPRLRAFWESLVRAATPPCEGGEYASPVNPHLLDAVTFMAGSRMRSST